MKGSYSSIERKGLPGGPNEQFTYITGVFSSDVFSTEGYKRNSPDKNNPFNIIPSGNITMKGVDFPVMGMDNLGNTKAMIPGNDYKFPGDMVFETPMYKRGGGLLTKTMKCNSCGWSWKAADGGNDVTTCHKCGGEALPKAQGGGSKKEEPIIVPAGDPRQQAYSDSLAGYNNMRYVDRFDTGWKEANNVPIYNWDGFDPKKLKDTGTVKPVSWKPFYKQVGEFDEATDHGLGELAVFKKPVQPVFTEGSKEAEIVKKQQKLKEQGLYKGKIDGIWGDKSQAAWKQYTESREQPVEETIQGQQEEKSEDVVIPTNTAPKKGQIEVPGWKQEWISDDTHPGGGYWKKVYSPTYKDVSPPNYALGGFMERVYQNGGEEPIIPIIVPPGDPRVQAYADSSNLYNYYNTQKGLVGSTLRPGSTDWSVVDGDIDERDKYWNDIQDVYKSMLVRLKEDVSKSPYLMYDPEIREEFKHIRETLAKPPSYFQRASDQELWVIGDNLIKSDPNYFWANAASSPDLAHKTIKPIGSYSEDNKDGPLNAIYKKPVQPYYEEGSKKAEIIKKQIELKEAGLYEGKIDGIWGDKSQAAWEQYVKSSDKKTTEETVQDNPYEGENEFLTAEPYEGSNTNNEQTTQESTVDESSDDVSVKELKRPVEIIKQRPGAWYRDEAGNLKQWWPEKQQGGGVLTYKDSADNHPAGAYQKRIKRKIPIEGSAPQYQTGGGTVKGRAATSTRPNRKKQLTTTPKSEKPLTTNEDQILTYKDNADWFDSRARYSDNLQYDDSIRKAVYSGKYGYNPTTQILYPLKKEDQVEISDEIKNILDLQQEKIDERDRVRAMSPEDQEAYRRKKLAASLRASGKQPITIDEIGGRSNPLLREEDRTGRRPWEGKAGQTLFLTPEEIKAYNKDWVAKSMVAVGENPLFYAPGIIAGGAALPALGEAAFAGAAPYFSAPITVGGTTIPGATAANLINAGFAGHGLYNVGPDAVDFATNPSWEGAGNLAMDALEIAPIAGSAVRGTVEGYNAAKQVANKLGNKYLPNAYKHNPWAFKTNPEAYYRQVSKEAIDDAFINKLIREKGEEVTPENYKKFQSQLKDLAGTNEYKNYEEKYRAMAVANSHGPMPYFQRGELFYGNRPTLKVRKKEIPLKERKVVNLDYLIESNYKPEAFQNSYGYKMNLGNPEEIGSVGVLKPDPNLRSLENFNIYKRDWWKGYKPIDTPKQLPGSPNAPTSWFNGKRQNALLVEQARRSGEAPLPDYMTPYISRRYTPATKQQEIFESFLLPEQQEKLRELRTQRFTREGPVPSNAASSIDNVTKAGIDGNFITRPLTPFTKNELTPGKHLYRKIGGRKGLEDLINKQGAQAPAPLRMNTGQRIDTPFFGVGKSPNENYSGIFAVETSLPSKSKYDWSSGVGGTSNYGVAPIDKNTGELIKNIPLDDLEVFRKKWFSNNYRKLDKSKLQEELKSASLQELSEKLYKWGIRGYLADQILNDGDLTGGKAVEIIEENLEGWLDQNQTGGEIIPEDVKNMKAALDKELKAVKNYNLTPEKKNKLIQELYTIYNESVPPKFQLGGPVLSAELQMYKDYITGKDESPEAVKNYDKLNRVHYKKAKANNTSPANYIMTELIS